MFEAFDEVVCEQVREWELEVDALDTTFADPDLLEEDLVEGTADLVGGAGVGLEAVGGEGESLIEVALDLVEAQRAGVEDTLDLGFLGADSCLFLAQEVDGDGVGVVGVEELAAFVTQLGSRRC